MLNGLLSQKLLVGPKEMNSLSQVIGVSQWFRLYSPVDCFQKLQLVRESFRELIDASVILNVSYTMANNNTLTAF